VKFVKVLALIAVLGCSAVVAHADSGSDPTVVINKFPDPTSCDPSTDATCIVQGGSVNVDLSQSTLFDVGGSVPITFLTVTFQGIVGDSYTCETDIFVTCSAINTGTTVVMDLFMGGPGTCVDSGQPVQPQCPGEIPVGQEFTVAGIGFTSPTIASVNAPEPGTYALLLGGLIALLAFNKKRQGAGFSA
jgi:hypothetical protein